MSIRRNIQLEYFSQGCFYYFGCANQLTHSLRQVAINIEEIQLRFNIDGIPLFKSVPTQLWCILGASDVPDTSVFPVAIFCGDKKPDLELFLNKFVEELKEIIPNGVKLKNGELVKLTMGPVICDAPAKAFIKNIIQFNGKCGCDYCQQEGIHVGSVAYSQITGEKRTNKSFRDRVQPQHHRGFSPFEKLQFVDMIYHFVHDSLHLLNLGVMKRLTNMWVFEPKGRFRLKCADVGVASSRMMSAAKFKPVEFNREPRSFQCFKLFKGHEWEHEILYYGMVVWKDILPVPQYNHF